MATSYCKVSNQSSYTLELTDISLDYENSRPSKTIYQPGETMECSAWGIISVDGGGTLKATCEGQEAVSLCFHFHWSAFTDSPKLEGWMTASKDQIFNIYGVGGTDDDTIVLTVKDWPM